MTELFFGHFEVKFLVRVEVMLLLGIIFPVWQSS